MPEDMFGPYRVLHRIGRGGMGEVHEAYDTVRARTVALKRLIPDADDPAVRERFRRESKIAARLDSPHVVPIHDFGVIDGQLFIDMRLVRGVDLGDLLDAEGSLEPARAVLIVGQVADALDAAHAAGLVHRDVKPSNILLTGHRGRDFAYLADFGIVHVRDATAQERLTGTGAAVGTPAYMAPEQMRSTTFDHRLDVYALACVLFRMVTGRPPFVGDTVAVLYDHVHTAPPRPSELRRLPPGLDAVLLRALDKEPARRPASAGEFADAARRALDPPRSSLPRPSGTPAVPAPPPAPRPGPRPPPAPRPPAEATQPALPVPPARRPEPADPSEPADEPTAAAAPRSPASWGFVTVALVLAVLIPPLGLVLGVIALRGSRPRTGPRAVLPIVATAVGGVLTVVALAVVLPALRGGPFVPARTVEAQIVAQSGLGAEQVSCPGPLPAEVGASIVCTARSGERVQPLRTTVTSTEDGRVLFDITAE